MLRETVVYGGKRYHRYPESKRRQLRVYFWRHSKWKEPPVALHRQIWTDLYGPIPKGFVIHHKDDNPINNAISNLEIMSRGEHARGHMTPERRKLSSKNYRNFLLPKPRKVQCIECHKSFYVKRKKGALYCNWRCGKFFRKKNRILEKIKEAM